MYYLIGKSNACGFSHLIKVGESF